MIKKCNYSHTHMYRYLKTWRSIYSRNSSMNAVPFIEQVLKRRQCHLLRYASTLWWTDRQRQTVDTGRIPLSCHKNEILLDCAFMLICDPYLSVHLCEQHRKLKTKLMIYRQGYWQRNRQISYSSMLPFIKSRNMKEVHSFGITTIQNRASHFFFVIIQQYTL